MLKEQLAGSAAGGERSALPRMVASRSLASGGGTALGFSSRSQSPARVLVALLCDTHEGSREPAALKPSNHRLAVNR
jgi:hypothetical protein